LAADPDRRQAGHAHPLASERIPALLEMEVSVARSAKSSIDTKVDRPHGFEQSDMGRGTDRKRAFAKDWNSNQCCPVEHFEQPNKFNSINA
jgi:hypothetical protein